MTTTPATQTEILGATRTHTHRAVQFTPCGQDSRCPCTGKMAIATKKGREEYGVTELGIGTGFPPGVAFRLTKQDGESYACLVANRREWSTCDCAGWTYQASRKADARHKTTSDTCGCKHLDGLIAIIDNGWLCDPRVNPDQDVTSTEAE